MKSDKRPALFKSNSHRPNVIYRVGVELHELNEEEHADYYSVVNASKELEELIQTNYPAAESQYSDVVEISTAEE